MKADVQEDAAWSTADMTDDEHLLVMSIWACKVLLRQSLSDVVVSAIAAFSQPSKVVKVNKDILLPLIMGIS